MGEIGRHGPLLFAHVRPRPTRAACIHLHNLKCCTKILFILMTQCFGASLNPAARVRASPARPPSWPCSLLLGSCTHLTGSGAGKL